MASMKLRRQPDPRLRVDGPVLHGANLRAADIDVGVAGRTLGRVGLEAFDRRLEPVAHPTRLVRQAAELARDLGVLLLVRDGPELARMQVADPRDAVVEIARRRLDLVDLRRELGAGGTDLRTCSKKALGSRRSLPALPAGPPIAPEPYCGPEAGPPLAGPRCGYAAG